MTALGVRQKDVFLVLAFLVRYKPSGSIAFYDVSLVAIGDVLLVAKKVERRGIIFVSNFDSGVAWEAVQV